MPESVDNKVFKFSLDKRIFNLRAKNVEEKNKWMSVITLLKNKLIEKSVEREKQNKKQILH